MVKRDVTDTLKRYRRQGVKIFTWNHNHRTPGGANGWPDHCIIIDTGHIILIEVKLNRDQLRPAQIETAEILRAAGNINDGIVYMEIHNMDDLEMACKKIENILYQRWNNENNNQIK